MGPTPGQRLGNYRLDRKLGQGGMGAVYLATDTRLDRQVAIKFLAAEMTSSDELRQRFRREALLAAGISLPNVATVHDVGEQDGSTFIVMEYVQGESLRHLIDRGPIGVERTVAIAIRVAAGLAGAHRQGVSCATGFEPSPRINGPECAIVATPSTSDASSGEATAALRPPPRRHTPCRTWADRPAPSSHS